MSYDKEWMQRMMDNNPNLNSSMQELKNSIAGAFAAGSRDCNTCRYDKTCDHTTGMCNRLHGTIQPDANTRRFK